jgi:hypothetical protein
LCDLWTFLTKGNGRVYFAKIPPTSRKISSVPFFVPPMPFLSTTIHLSLRQNFVLNKYGGISDARGMVLLSILHLLFSDGLMDDGFEILSSFEVMMWVSSKKKGHDVGTRNYLIESKVLPLFWHVVTEKTYY